MNKLYVNLQNCYGIKKLDTTFDFESCRAYLIYAQNGAMKTSFAEVFGDVNKGEKAKDRIYKGRDSKYEIKCDDIHDLRPEQVLVVKPYIEKYKSGETQATLLVNETLKEKYETIRQGINDKKNELLKEISNLSGLKKDMIEHIFINSFKKKGDDFYSVLENIEETILDGIEPLFPQIRYNEIFNAVVEKFLKTKDFKSKIKEYIEIYNNLIEKSTFYKKGIFNHYNADEISKSLKGNNFFLAEHTVLLNSNSNKKEIKSESELNQLFTKEREQILNSKELVGKFEAIDNAIKNKELRDFRTYLENNKEIIPELENLEEFSKKLWISYLKKEVSLFEELLTLYKDGKVEMTKIIDTARNEITIWEKVVCIFNERFTVPFEIIVENQVDVILHSALPTTIFEYTDESTGEKAKIGEDDLLLSLSLGEKRALYLLNIIFEIEVKKKRAGKTLLIIDDIADSFDYKNKYAIIEYLKETLDTGMFNMIILTHNFDFHRTVAGRLNIKSCNVLNSKKKSGVISLEKEIYQNNPLKYWRNNFHKKDEILIASIPFVRNLIEYTVGDSHDNYSKLTSLLHIKSDTASILVQDLEIIFNSTFGLTRELVNKSRSVHDLIMELADNLSSNLIETIDLENKIVLSIAIRLLAEKYMISCISDTNFFLSLEKKKNQTRVLYDKVKFDNEVDRNIMQTLEKVNLMTPENIHLNSFMYEPILDLSDTHLKKLYLEVKNIH